MHSNFLVRCAAYLGLFGDSARLQCGVHWAINGLTVSLALRMAVGQSRSH